MPNFGTYEGHRLLSSAMANAVNSVTKGYESKIQQEQWEKEQAEQKENNLVARARANQQLISQKREYDASVARDNVIKGMYSDKLQGNVLTKNEDGSIGIADNAVGLIDDWSKQHDYSYYLSQPGGQDLTHADMQYVNEASTDFAKTKLAEIQKQLVNVNESDYNKLFADNSEFATSMEKYLIDIGSKKDPGKTWYETMNPTTSSSALEDEIGAANWFTAGTDQDGYMTVHNDTSEYGGGTYFKSTTGVPNQKQVKDKKILLEAVKNMRDAEVKAAPHWYSRGSGNSLDDMWLEHSASGDGTGTWMLGEDDFGHNDYFEVRVKNGKAEVKVDGTWKGMGHYVPKGTW